MKMQKRASSVLMDDACVSEIKSVRRIVFVLALVEAEQTLGENAHADDVLSGFGVDHQNQQKCIELVPGHFDLAAFDGADACAGNAAQIAEIRLAQPQHFAHCGQTAGHCLHHFLFFRRGELRHREYAPSPIGGAGMGIILFIVPFYGLRFNTVFSFL